MPIPASTFTVQRIEGLAELEKSLRKMREIFGVKTGGIIIRGLRKGAKLIRDEARNRTPEVPSNYASFARTSKGKRLSTSRLRSILRRNIVEYAIPTDSKLAGGKPTVIVRVRNQGYERTSRGGIRFINPSTSPGWWWWLEFGTSKRSATPFMRPAFEAQKLAALEAFRSSVREEIEAFWAANLPFYRRGG